HTMTLVRRRLTDLEVRPIQACYSLGDALAGGPGASDSSSSDPIAAITVAGLVVLRQRPPTAKGVLFVLLEDETGYVQCIVRPEALERLGPALQKGALIARGRLHAERGWRGLVL